jgi:hypothetical protein
VSCVYIAHIAHEPHPLDWAAHALDVPNNTFVLVPILPNILPILPNILPIPPIILPIPPAPAGGAAHYFAHYFAQLRG